MKKNRVLAIYAAVSLLLCGCQKTADTTLPPMASQMEEASETDTVPLVDDTLTTTVKLENLSYPDGVDGFGSLIPTADGFLGIGYTDWSETHLYQYDCTLTDPTEIILVPPAPYDGYYYKGGLTAVTGDGFCTLTLMENHSNLTPADWEAEDFDWEIYGAQCDTDYYLCRYAKDGTLTDKVKIEGLEDYKKQQGSDRYEQFSDLYACAGGVYLLLMDGTILRIEADGTLTETSPALFDEGDYLNYVDYLSLLSDRDGKIVYCLNSTVSDGVNGYQCVVGISEFDEQTGKPGEPIYSAATDNNTLSYNAAPGCGDYRLFVTVGDKTLGIRDDGSTETVIDWKASDYDAMYVIPLPDGSFATQQNGHLENKLCHVIRKRSSEIKEKQTITLGVLGVTEDDFAQEFNRTHDDYQINVVEYEYEYADDKTDQQIAQEALDRLRLAIMSDDAPDLILMNEQHEQILKLGSKGVFADLNEFMADDPDVSRDRMVSNVLDALQHPNGALYALPRGFEVESVAVKSKFNVPENWTLDDMYALYEDAGDRLYYWTTKTQMLQFFLTGMDFTDELAGTCDFASEDFIRVLEFCDRYPLESNEPEHDKESMESMERYQQWAYDEFLRFQRDEDYLYFTGFSGFDGKSGMASSYAYTKGDLGGDFTLAGYPSNNGQGGKITAIGEMGILSTCKDKAAAWEVVKAFAASADSTGMDRGYSLFEEQFEEQLDKEMYIWDFGRKTDEEYYQDDAKVYPLTQAERDGLEEYIRSCRTFMMVDPVVENIAMEEAGKFFAGDCNAEDAAKAIQNRAELYLSEQS